jgi:hypothetical protein
VDAHFQVTAFEDVGALPCGGSLTGGKWYGTAIFLHPVHVLYLDLFAD